MPGSSDSNSSARSRTSLEKVLLPLGFLFVCGIYLFHALKLNFLTDDAYIYFRYAQNMAEGFGPVFNPDQRVEGYTGPLWLALLAFCKLLGIQPEISSRVMGIAAGLGTLLIVFRSGLKLFAGKPAWLALAAPLMLSANRTFAGWSTSGLETALFTFFIVWAFSRLAMEWTQNERCLSGVLFALAALSRPEGLLFIAMAGLLLLIRERSLKVRPFSIVLSWSAPIVILVGGHLVFRMLYYGYPFPNTFYAKVSGAWWEMGFIYLGTFILEYGFLTLPPLLLAGLFGDSRLRNITISCLLVLIPYLVYLASIGGDHFEFRFLHVLLPFALFPTPWAIWNLLYFIKKSVLRHGFTALMLYSLLAFESIIPFATAWSGDKYNTARPPVASRENLPSYMYHSSYDLWFRTYNHLYEILAKNYIALRIEEHRAFSNRQLTQADFILQAMEDGLIHSDESIAIACIGVVPYKTRLWTLDIHGLTDSTVAHEKVADRGLMGHEKRATLQYAKSLGIDYIVVQPSMFFLEHNTLEYALRISSKKVFYLLPYKDVYFVFESTKDLGELYTRFASRGYQLKRFYKGTIQSISPIQQQPN